MDNDQQVQLIEARLDALDGIPVSDDQSAREAFTLVMVTVSRISQLSPQAQAQAITGAGAPVDDILEKLRKWLDRLVSALTRIVENLSDAISFSISVGSNVSVTADFGRCESGPAWPPGGPHPPATGGLRAARVAGRARACPLFLPPGAAEAPVSETDRQRVLRRRTMPMPPATAISASVKTEARRTSGQPGVAAAAPPATRPPVSLGAAGPDGAGTDVPRSWRSTPRA